MEKAIINTKIITNPILSIPEPRHTIGLTHIAILKLIKKHYKPTTKNGKEHNLISGYTNAVYNKIFDDKEFKLTDTIMFKFSHIRYDWIIAVFRYFAKNVEIIEVEGGIVCKPIKK